MYNIPLYLKGLLLLFILSFIFITLKGQNCAANAGIDQSICVGQPLNLTGIAGNPQSTTPAYLWSQVSGPSSVITTPTALTTSVTGVMPGNYVFQFSNKCGDNLFATNLVSITVSPVPPTSLAGNDTAICTAGPIQLSANAVAAPFTGTWTVTPNTGTFSPNVNAANASYTPVSGSNTYTLKWTITNGNCVTTSSKILKVVTPSAVSAGPNQTLSCVGNCATFTASNPGISPPQTGIWSQVSGPASPIVFSNINSPTSSVCNLVAGTYVFRWSVSGPCITNSATVTINVNNVYNPPLGSDFIQYQNFCGTPPVTFQVLSGSGTGYGETGSWSQTSGGTAPYPNVTFVPNNSGSSVAVTGMTGLFPYVFKYTKSNAAGCVINGTHIVYRNPAITNLSNPPNLDLACDVLSTTFTLTYDDVNMVEKGLSRIGTPLILPTGATGSFSATFTSSSNPGVIGTGTRTDLWTVTGISVAGTYIVRMEYKNSCGIQYRDIRITASRTPGIINTGSNLVLPCSRLYANLIASGNSPLNLTWSQISGPNTAVLSGATTNSLTMTGLDSGLYRMRLTNSGGSTCPAVKGELTVTVSRAAPYVATTGPNAIICFGNYRLIGNVPKPNETGNWTVIPSAGIIFSNASDPQTYVSNLLQNTAYTFTWTITNTCGSISSSQVLTTNNIPAPNIPNAGTDICLPSGTQSASLSGSNPGSSIILWTALSASSAVVVNNTQSVTASITGGNGLYLFEYSLSTPGCTTFRDTVSVTINTVIPVVNAGTNVDVCAPSLPASATLTASPAPPAGTTANWTQISGPAVASIANPTSPSTAVSNLRQGLYEFEYRVSSGTCNDRFDTVVVRVAQEPTNAYAGPDQTLCSTTPATLVNLAATAAGVGIGYWEVSTAPRGSATASFGYLLAANTTINNLTQGTYVVKWTTFNGPACPSKISFVNLNINAAADAGPDINLCDKASVALSGSPNTTGVWALVSGPSGTTITANSSNTAVVTGLVSSATGNQYVFSYTLPAAGSCPGTTDNMTVTDFAAPILVDAGPDQLLCSNISTVTMTGNSQTAGTGSWLLKKGPNTPTPGTANGTYQDTTINNLVAGLYVFQYIINTNAACIGSGDSIQIIKEASAAVIPAVQRFCNVNSINLTGNVPVAHTASWSIASGPSTPTFSNVNNPATAVSGLVTGTYIFTWTIAGEVGCPTNSADVKIIIDAPVANINAGADSTFCEGTVTPFALGIDPAAGLTYVWSPATLLSSAGVAQPNFTGVNNAGTYTYTLEADNGSCHAFDAVTIKVIPKPGANINVTSGTCSANFSATDVGVGVNGPVSYAWAFGNPLTATPATATSAGPNSVAFSNGNPRSISLSVNSADGCGNNKSLSYSPLCPLPLTLLTFTAVNEQPFVKLNWQVTAVINFKQFEVERSLDGLQFTTIDSVAFNENIYNYKFNDNVIFITSGKVFYRLKLIDNDGSYTYSEIRVVLLQQPNNFIVSPDPFVNKIKISFKSYPFPKKIRLHLLNITNQIVVIKQEILDAGQSDIEITNLNNIKPGMYTLQFITDDFIKNFKIIKLSLK